MYLKHNDLVIRNAGPEDAAQLAAWWNDGAVMAHAGFPLGLGTTPETVAAGMSRDSDDTRCLLILEYQGRSIGEMSFRCRQDGAAEMGIKICDAAMQERGLGRQYLSMLIAALFGRGQRKIVLDTNLNNLRAQHVYESLGFTRLGVQENCWQDQLGRPQSAVDYELLPENFRSFC